MPNVLIGDEAYPLKKYLMRPYPRRVHTPRKEYFNTRLSTARKCIECVFGILYSKWRFLSKDIETYPDKACVLIKCACILHNFIRIHDGETDLDYCTVMENLTIQTYENAVPLNQEGGRNNNRSSREATQIREIFGTYLYEHQ